MEKRSVAGCFRKGLFLTALVVIAFFSCSGGVFAQQEFYLHCYEAYLNNETCPQDVCVLKTCTDEQKEQGCQDICTPKSCQDIPLTQCPTDYCSIMVDCSGKEVCHFRMPGEAPSCGDMAYEGQDVDCCEGFIRRCGVEFLDDTCDMIGENSIYNLPVCIPCGDNRCGQFENACNCPEDCGDGDYKGFDYTEYLEQKGESQTKKGWLNFGGQKKSPDPQQ